jgi:hypothetical protein
MRERDAEEDIFSELSPHNFLTKTEKKTFGWFFVVLVG